MGLTKLSLSLLALAGSSLAADMPKITMKGSKFFYEDGTQFFMKGVAYQQDTSAAGATSKNHDSYTDPLIDEDLCKRDIKYLKQLKTNTIRTYAIDPEEDHSKCMKLLQEAGIYVVSDLGQPKLSIERESPQWNTELFDRYKKVVDELAQYDNVIGFFAGNEVSNNNTNTGASAYVKAAVRDTKKYIADQNYRWMGVGYAANDDKDIREEIADYFNCGDQDDAIDFWGYNIYSWCGESSFEKSGYDEQVKFFEDYSVPVFFAEYGCNKPDGANGRTFDDTPVLYSDKMTGVFSGGIVYMYFQEDNDYGLVKIDKNDKVDPLDDFDELKKKISKVKPSGVDKDDYKPTASPASCPKLSKTWQAASILPPTPDEDLCDCMSKSRNCIRKKGLDSDDFKDLFDFICDAKPEVCAGINGDPSIGVYGAYSMCPDGQKLDYVLDAYYQAMGQSADACDFDGSATLTKSTKDDTCKKALASASKVNELAATATAPVSGAAATGSDDGDDESAASVARAFNIGGFGVGAYMAIAMGVGATMVAL